MTGKTSAAKGGRYLALDSLRGLLACTIVLYHMPNTGYLWRLSTIQHGFLAVTFFFVLSGFVIGTTYGDRLAKGFPVGRFLGLRLGRIYPLHMFMIAVIAAWQLVRLATGWGGARADLPFTGAFGWHWLPYHLLLLQKFGEMVSWNDPSWSIGVEWWTYLVFALLAAMTPRLRGMSVVALLLILPAVVIRVLHRDPGDGVAGTLDCMMCFGLGLIVCEMRKWRLWRMTDRLGPGGATAAELLTAALAFDMIAAFGGKLSPAIAPTFAIVVMVFSLERGVLSRLLVTTPMLLLGELSYSIYMVHHFILDRMLDLLWRFGGALPLRVTPSGRTVLTGTALACDLFSLIVLGLVIVVSRYSYRYIETPARLWSRRMVNTNHSETVTPRDPTAAF